jgi:hypothetical protein
MQTYEFRQEAKQVSNYAHVVEFSRIYCPLEIWVERFIRGLLLVSLLS